MMRRNVKTRALAAIAVAVFAVAGAASALGASKFVVSFRLANWKAAHFDDAATAKRHYDTMRQLDCEAKQDGHDGHFDVSYRSPLWRSVSLKSDHEAHQWSQWLGKNGFETIFVQPAQPGHLETVAFRLTSAKSSHFDSAEQAGSQADTLKTLGCEVKQRSHSGHYDVSYRCPQWRVIGVESHDDALKWEKWLKANGFEARHDHKTAQNTGETKRGR